MVQVNILYPKIQSGDIDLDSWFQSISQKNQLVDISYIKSIVNFLSGLTESDENNYNNKKFLKSLETATILVDLNMDVESIAVGLLLTSVHDKDDLEMLSDNKKILESIAVNFSDNIVKLLKGVMKMDAIRNLTNNLNDNSSNEVNSDQFRKMLLAMVSDPRVVVIRLADHLCDLRSCRKESEQIQKELAKETKLIYGPLANRLGIGQLKWELEDLSFRYLKKDLYKEIASLLDEKRIDRDNYIANLINVIKEKLAENNIKADVTGRVKHIYSIWRKMRRKNLDYHDLYDIRAVRVITSNITECYTALGIIHSLWQYIPKEFDDYIATPKENGYQSLHTAVIGPDGKTVEVQIRTEQMHNDSELGVAAHWRYKEGVSYDSSFDAKIAWLRQLIEWQDEITSTELLEEMQNSIAEDRIYVLTPNGDVYDLPDGATPLDFAYHIHTEIGHRCRGAKVNGKMVQLTSKLETGDKVEILTRNNSQPSLDWLNPHFNFLKTARARSKVQAWFRKQDASRVLEDGKNILEKELSKLNIKNIDIDLALSKLNFKTEDEVLIALGRGELKLNQLLAAANIAITAQKSSKIYEDTNDLEQEIVPIPGKLRKKSSKSITVAGVDNLLTSIAKCCKPLPGIDIIGYVSQGKGITIHATDCINVEQLRETHPDKLIEVEWDKKADSMLFAVDIFLQSRDRQGLLRDMTGLLSAEKINIINLKTNTDKTGMVHTYLTIEISSVDELGRILDRLQTLPNILVAKRITAKD